MTFLSLLKTLISPAMSGGEVILIRNISAKTSLFRNFTTLKEFSQALSISLLLALLDTPGLRLYPGGMISVFAFVAGSRFPGL